MCDWKAPRPEGRALGVSITERSGSLGAGVVEISLDRHDRQDQGPQGVGRGRRRRRSCSPATAQANIESGIIYGLSSVLHERVTLKDGVVEQSNFHDYNVMRMSDMPEEMDVHSSTSTRGRPAWARSAIR